MSLVIVRPSGITTIAFPPVAFSCVNSRVVCCVLTPSFSVSFATLSRSSPWLPCAIPSIGIRRALKPVPLSVTLISPALGDLESTPFQPPTRWSARRASARATAAFPALRWSASSPAGSSRAGGSIVACAVSSSRSRWCFRTSRHYRA